MKDEEHQEQAALFEWAEVYVNIMPDLNMLAAIPNGGKRHIGVAIKLKKEGVKKSYPDLTLDVARGGYHGLKIEMKKKKGGYANADQKEYGERLLRHGYLWRVCNGWFEARDLIVNYLHGKEIR